MRTKKEWKREELPIPDLSLEENEERERADMVFMEPGVRFRPCGNCEKSRQNENPYGEGWTCPVWPSGIPEDVYGTNDPEKHQCMEPMAGEVFSGRKWRMLPDGSLEWID